MAVGRRRRGPLARPCPPAWPSPPLLVPRRRPYRSRTPCSPQQWFPPRLTTSRRTPRPSPPSIGPTASSRMRLPRIAVRLLLTAAAERRATAVPPAPGELAPVSAVTAIQAVAQRV